MASMPKLPEFKEPTYILYSPRGLGWFTSSSTYSSDISQARPFSRAEALDMRRRHTTDAGHNMLPIRLEDMQ